MTVKVSIEESCHIYKGKTSIKWVELGKYPLMTTAEEKLSSKNFDFDLQAVCVPLISSTGHGHASIKRIHYYSGKFALASIMCAISSKDENFLLTEYLYVYLLLLKDSLLVSLMRGSANVSLTINEIKKVQVNIPSIEIQKTLINLYKLNNKRYTSLKNYFSAQEQKIKRLEESVLHEVFEGKYNNANIEGVYKIYEKIHQTNKQIIKEDWNAVVQQNREYYTNEKWVWCKLGNIVEKLGAGSTPKGGNAVYQSEGIIFLRSQNIHNEGIELSQPVFIPEEINDRMLGSQVKPLDILLNITGASMGRNTIFFDKELKANVSQHVAIVRLIDKGLAEYIHLYMISPVFQSDIQKAQTGISREGLSMRELQNVKIPLCSYQQQEIILNKMRSFRKLEEELKKSFQNSLKDAEELFNNLISSFFSKYIKLESERVVSPFVFTNSLKISQFDNMKTTPLRSVRGSISKLNIDVLKEEFKTNNFGFQDIYDKTSLDYDLLKDAVFDVLIKNNKESQSVSLNLYFDEIEKRMQFKIKTA